MLRHRLRYAAYVVVGSVVLQLGLCGVVDAFLPGGGY